MKLLHGRALAGAVTALVAVGAGLLVTAPVSGAATNRLAVSAPPVTAGSDYLALGDSVTFGYEEPGVVPAPDYHNAASFLGYPEQLGDELHLKVTNASCPGETSGSLVDAAAESNGCENTVGKPGGYRVSYPLHVHYKGSQLAYALAYLRAHPDTTLVSLMIGANDLFICEETTKDGCASASEQGPVLAKISSNVHRMLAAIRGKAHYTGQLAIVNYYSLNYASAFYTNASEALNRAMDTAAKPFHAEIANGFGELKAAALHFGGNTCGAGLLTYLGKPGDCGVHPSYAGQALLAQALEKAIRL
jgi:lysophospholipase L1-like esterase